MPSGLILAECQNKDQTRHGQKRHTKGDGVMHLGCIEKDMPVIKKGVARRDSDAEDTKEKVYVMMLV